MKSVYLCKDVNVGGRLGQAWQCHAKSTESGWSDNEMGGYPTMKWRNKITYLDALTSAPCSTSSFTSRSFPPDDAACNGNTSSRTELIGVRARAHT